MEKKKPDKPPFDNMVYLRSVLPVEESASVSISCDNGDECSNDQNPADNPVYFDELPFPVSFHTVISGLKVLLTIFICHDTSQFLRSDKKIILFIIIDTVLFIIMYYP